MRVKDLGEFGVIQHLTGMITSGRKESDHAAARNIELVVDARDDTAAWRCGDVTELFTTDTAVEGVHFTRTTIPWEDLGWKIMAANISDIAAMGGLPLYSLITLGLPPETEMEHLESLYQGMMGLANRYGVSVVGGDMVRSPVVFVTVALTGVSEGEPMLRSTAQSGDLIGVTGYLGSSAGGLDILLKGLPVQGGAGEYVIEAHRRPEPCIPQGLVLSRHGIRTAMDISDGLVDDLSKLCRASHQAARLDALRIPVHPVLKGLFPQGFMDMALGGGEDYQLLFTAPQDLMDRVLPLLPTPAAVIGEIMEGEEGRVTVLDSEGVRELRAASAGWDHFRPVKGEP